MPLEGTTYLFELGALSKLLVCILSVCLMVLTPAHTRAAAGTVRVLACKPLSLPASVQPFYASMPVLSAPAQGVSQQQAAALPRANWVQESVAPVVPPVML